MSETSPESAGEQRHPTRFFTWQLTDPFKVERYLWGLTLANCTPRFEQQFYSPGNGDYDKFSVLESDCLKVSTMMCCSLCGAEFESRDDQVQHYKSDWHRYNLKQKLMGRLPLTEQSFLDTMEEISSISGSESDTGGESATDVTSSGGEAENPLRRPGQNLRGARQGRRERSASVTSTDTEGEDTECDTADARGSRMNSKIYFKNGDGQVLALYRCIVHGKLAAPPTQEQLIEAVCGIPGNVRWAVVMVGGGHFAAAIFHGGGVVVHKTFHRYTVRAKQGSSQSSRDGKQKGSQPKSAGATLRRHNESALVKDIQDLLSSWSIELEKCTGIFYRAPGSSRSCLFSGKLPPFKKTDPRLRSIPFPTKRATHSEVLRVHKLLNTVECFGSEASLNGCVPASPRAHSASPKKSGNRSPEKRREEQRRVVPADPVPEEMPNPAERAGVFYDGSGVEADGANSSLSCVVERELAEGPIGVPGPREFASTRGRSRGRHKKGKIRGVDSSSFTRSAPSEYLALRTALFEACQSGNLEALSRMLGELAESAEVLPEGGTRVTRGETEVSCAERVGQNALRNIEDRSEIGSSMAASLNLPVDSEKNVEVDDGGASKQELRTPQNEDGKLLGTLVTVQRLSDGWISDRQDLSVKVDGADSSLALLLSPTGSDPDATPVVEERTVLWDARERRPSPEGPTLGACCEVVRSCGLRQELLDSPTDDSGTTLLHYCSAHSFPKLVRCLLEAGADPTLRNAKGRTPYAVASDRQTRQEFSRFRAVNPDMFDYDRAQIPCGLSEEMEKEKYVKNAEKQKEKRKLHREKLKERKAAEAERLREEAERQRFLALSDREKRALMAERRFAQQLLTTGTPYVVLSRCFACAADITGKVPFEYNENKFCSVDCVKQHRQKSARS